MRSLSEICQLVKDELITSKLRGEIYGSSGFVKHKGLCSVINTLQNHNKINKEEQNLFRSVLINYAKTRTTFYDNEGIRVKRKSQFFWKTYNKKPRIKWLDERILN